VHPAPAPRFSRSVPDPLTARATGAADAAAVLRRWGLEEGAIGPLGAAAAGGTAATDPAR
jgi:hypothetical protein